MEFRQRWKAPSAKRSNGLEMSPGAKRRDSIDLSGRLCFVEFDSGAQDENRNLPQAPACQNPMCTSSASTSRAGPSTAMVRPQHANTSLQGSLIASLARSAPVSM